MRVTAGAVFDSPSTCVKTRQPSVVGRSRAVGCQQTSAMDSRRFAHGFLVTRTTLNFCTNHRLLGAEFDVLSCGMIRQSASTAVGRRTALVGQGQAATCGQCRRLRLSTARQPCRIHRNKYERILITGKTGQVGYELEAAARLGRSHRLDRSQMDLADLNQVRNVIRRVKPTLIATRPPTRRRQGGERARVGHAHQWRGAGYHG